MKKKNQKVKQKPRITADYQLVIRGFILDIYTKLVLNSQIVRARYFGILLCTDNRVTVGFACFSSSICVVGAVDDGIFPNLRAVTEHVILITAVSRCVPG